MVVGVIPAAGYATRLGLRAGSKEMLEVGGRPVMDYLVERMRTAGAERLRVVTRPEKLDVIEHAASLGAELARGHPVDVAASVHLGLQGLAASDEVLLGFPDSIWEPVGGYLELLAALRTGARVALGLFTSDEPARSDVVTLDPAGRVGAVHVKPERPPGNVIWGIAAATAGTLRDVLREGTEPGVSFHGLARAGEVAGVLLSDVWVDVGTPQGLRSARLGEERELDER